MLGGKKHLQDFEMEQKEIRSQDTVISNPDSQHLPGGLGQGTSTSYKMIT